MVNVSVEVPPERIGFGAKRFEMIGGLILGQPVMVMLSRLAAAAALDAPAILILNVVVPRPVEAAEKLTGSHFCFAIAVPVPALNEPPSALE